MAMNDENCRPEMENEEVSGEIELSASDGKQTDLLYIGAKIITACHMDERTFLVEHKGQDGKGREYREGYRVTYPDGYISWSPKDVFETAYRVVTFGELALMK
jgi:hypothetical protein